MDSGDREQLVVVHELDRGRDRAADPGEIERAIRQAVTEEHEVEVAEVVLLRPAALPVTSSGKVRRQHCKQLYLQGELAMPPGGEWPGGERPGGAGEPGPARPAGTTWGYEPIVDWLVTRIAARRRLPAAQVGVHASFSTFGLDSATLVGISGELSAVLGRPVEPTLLYEHPTVARFARALSDGAAPPSGRRGRPPAEPVAVIGMACRFPGADSLGAFWDLLLSGRDAITEVPASRWQADQCYRPGPPVPGYASTRWGGFIEGVYRFDAGFFGISPQEARSMDPQQRLLLTLTWRALEDAGIGADTIAGSDTGVFVGISSNDYTRLQVREQAGLDAYSGTGNAFSVAANRLSYVLDLHGPSVAVDTACSSSLVAIHQAVTSLSQGECDLAIVAGVNLLLSPDLTVMFSQAGVMAPDGRCKPFDARADGYVRSEGCGVVILKRLAAARAARDTIYAVVRGSAVNQDGQSNSLTAPNGMAQEAVLRLALARAGLPPSRVGYLEAHGTGTSLGDPVEVAAVRRVYGEPRPGEPVWIGSVKANIGHLEAAAGIAGFIKAVLALRHGVIPRQLHFRELNPYISLAGSRCRIPVRAEEWRSGDHPRAAGVSSFGFGGTNTHVILEEPAAPAPQPGPVAREAGPLDGEQPGWELLPVSAKQGSALRQLAEDYAGFLDAPSAGPLAPICAAAGARRTQYGHRAAVVARSAPEAAGLLRQYAQGEEPGGVAAGVAAGRGTAPVAFLFTGQGAQYPGMARQLYARHAKFRQVLDQCDRIVTAAAGVSLLPTLCGTGGDQVDLGQTRFAQPALFAVEYAMTAMWRACGVEPDYVLGHSLGEYVAACVAEVMSAEDALRLLIRRAELMQEHSPPAAMYAVQAPEALLGELCAELRAAAPDQVAIAAFNGPGEVTLSGEAAAVAELADAWAIRGARTTQLTVNRAFHSPLMRAAAAQLGREARAVTYHPPRIGLVTNLTGVFAGASVPWAGYWTRQCAEPVQFGPGLACLREAGCRTLVEIGPHPALTAIGAASFPEARWLTTLHRDDADDRRFLCSLAEFYVHGGPVDWAGMARERRGDDAPPPPPVPLPGHPLVEAEHRYAPGQAAAPGTHPLLGAAVELAAAPGRWFAHTLRADRPPFLAQHQVLGGPVLPAAAMLEWALAAARAAAGPQQGPRQAAGPQHNAWTLEQITFNEPLRLPPDGQVAVQAVVGRDQRVRCFGRSAGQPDQPWTEHVTVVSARPAEAPAGAAVPPGPRSGMTELAIDGIYGRLAAAGLDYGPDFRALSGLWRDGDEACALVEVAAAVDEDGYLAQPVVLDASFHVAAAFLSEEDGLWLPAGVDQISVYDRLPRRVWCHARWRGIQASGDHVMDLELRSDHGGLLAGLLGLRLRQVTAQAFGAAGEPPLRQYRRVWQPLPASAEQGGGPVRAASDTWLVFSADRAVLRDWSAALSRPVLGVLTVPSGSDRGWSVDPTAEADITRLFAALDAEKVRIGGVVLHGPGAGTVAGGGPAERAYELTRRTVPLLQHVLRDNALRVVPVIICTTGAASLPVPASRAPDLAQSALAALTTAAAAEYPDLRFVHVDVDPDVPAPPDVVLDRVNRESGSGHLAQRGTDWYQARLQESELPGPAVLPSVQPSGTYLVTGGLGGLGLAVASWLAERGARTLLLVGRTVQAEEPAPIAALRARGVQVERLAADVAEEAGAARIAAALRGLPPLCGIVHAAGVTEDAPLEHLGWPGFTRVLDPKVRGAWQLHQLAESTRPGMFVLFSSMAALAGSPGQANYVVANTFLDALAGYRRHQGLPAVSLAWGPWAEAGMALRRGLLPSLAQLGVHALTTSEAVGALDRLLDSDVPHVGLAKVDWPRFLARSGRHQPYPALDRWAPAPPPELAVPGPDDGPAAEQIASLVLAEPESARQEVLSGLLRRVAAMLALDPGQREELRPTFAQLRLNALGIDSLMAVQLRNWLLAELSTDVPPQYLLGGNTVADVVELICQQLALRSLVATEADVGAAGTEALTL